MIYDGHWMTGAIKVAEAWAHAVARSASCAYRASLLALRLSRHAYPFPHHLKTWTCHVVYN